MKPSQPSDEIKKLFQTTSVPKIDVKDQVLQKLYGRNSQKEAHQMKRKMGLIVAACLVFVVTSAFAAIKVYELKNDKGEVVVQVNRTEQNTVSEPVSYNDKINEVRESLKPGTAVAVYVKSKDNPEKIIRFLQKAIDSTDRSELQSMVGNIFRFPAELVGGYSFTSGYIEHMVNHEVDEEAMRREADETNKDVVIKEIPVDKKIQRMSAAYARGTGEIRLNIDNLEEIQKISSDAGPDVTVEKVMIDQTEAIYHILTIQNQGKESRVIKYIKFLNNDKKQLFELRTRSADITKEDLVTVAKDLIKQQQ
ncbi:hypothetical protein [Brevibacillus sp. SYSU BS000544]|uniref:hypothetical protein n=1 Tax=Brevibacillus sp. SYSU BS000544 TaxID=3416443 RepID=UPI003CE4ECC7